MNIIQFICHLDVGGAETLVKDLACSQSASGHNVTVVLLDEFRTTPQAQVARKHLESHGVEVISLGRRPGQAPVAAAVALARLLGERQCDLIHSHLPLPDVVTTIARAGARRRVRHVSTIHNSNLAGDGMLWRLTISQRVNVFCSKAAASANPGLGRHSEVIVNGTSFAARTGEEESSRQQIRQEFGVGAADILLLNVGRIAEQKNQQCLIRAAKLLQESGAGKIHCLVAGRQDVASPDLARLAVDLGIADLVHLPGPRTDVPALLSAADLFVSTSLWEGLPLSVLEALFSGIRCVLSDLPEHREIGQGVPGVAFADPNDPQDFARAISRALHETADRAALRTQRETVLAPYTMDACAAAYLKLYSQTQPTEVK